MENTIDVNQKNNKLSVKGLLLSLLTTLGILIVQEVVSIFTGIRILDTYFVIGWILFPTISAAVYAKFGTGRENFVSIIIIAALNFLFTYVFYYFADVFFASVEYQVSYLETLLEVPIYRYFAIVFYDDILTIGAIELSNIKLLIFNLIGFVFYVYFTRKKINRINYCQSEQKIEDIANEMKADMSDNK